MCSDFGWLQTMVECILLFGRGKLPFTPGGASWVRSQRRDKGIRCSPVTRDKPTGRRSAHDQCKRGQRAPLEKTMDVRRPGGKRNAAPLMSARKGAVPGATRVYLVLCSSYHRLTALFAKLDAVRAWPRWTGERGGIHTRFIKIVVDVCE